MKLDELDLSILKRLQENGKITNLQLSKDIGLSPAPTLERVKKLESNGFIESYHALVNEAKLELGITTFMQISLIRQRDNAINNFIAQINNIDEVLELQVYSMTGQLVHKQMHEGQKEMKIDLSDLKGMYLLHIKTGSTVLTKKISIN